VPAATPLLMGNRFYVEGEKRGEKVNDLFARVAPRYDLINDLQSFGLHRAWKRKLVGMANVRRHRLRARPRGCAGERD
jgi:ubiquinone/menaquinone biosynthesis C-methylase UbiE